MGIISPIDIVSIAFSLVAAGFAVFTYVTNVIHDRKKATLEAYNTLQEQALDHLQVYMPKEIREIVKDNQSSQYKKISAYVARIEHFAVGVEQGIYDRKVVYELSKGFLDKAIKNRIDIVINEKENVGAGGYYNNIRSLLKWMEDEEKRRSNG